jgi:hypothetical protein
MVRNLAVIGFSILFGRAGARAAATEDYVRVPLLVMNEGSMPVQCTAELAHWYTETVLRVNKGTTGKAFVLSDPANGTLYLLNPSRTPMPVEQILCGHAGGPATALRFARRAGRVEQPIRLVCNDAGCGGS